MQKKANVLASSMTKFNLTIVCTAVTFKPRAKKMLQSSSFLSKKSKYALGIVIIAIVLISFFAFMPKGNRAAFVGPDTNSTVTPQPTDAQTTNSPNPNRNIGGALSGIVSGISNAVSPSKPPGIIESAQTIDKTVWMKVASSAWAYFQPEIGVDAVTGLPYAGIYWPYFTDWDLGVYIQAVIDANATGLIDSSGDWGSTMRIERVMRFLEIRPLNNYSYPYWFYQATDGSNYKYLSDTASWPCDTMDTGRLLVALNNLKTFNASLTPRINSILVRSNYSALLPSLRSLETSNNIYDYYMMNGYAKFFNNVSNIPSKILNNIVSGAQVSFDNGVKLPISKISCEPLLCSLFELPNDSRLVNLTTNVYLAHEAKTMVTKQYYAFSEGNSDSSGFIYEWVVNPDGSKWIVTDSKGSTLLDFKPIVYMKVAMCFLALYNTSYANNMVVYLEKNMPTPDHGYLDGIYYNTIGNPNIIPDIGSNTNGLIIEAAKYAINNSP